MAPVDDDVLSARPWARAVAGELAADVAVGLATPLAGLRDALALLVDRIDRHIASQTGPTPYPWRSLQAMRQDLAAAYLSATTMAELASDLSAVVGALGAGVAEVDVAPHVELAVSLARHHVAPGVELLVDLASSPPVRVAPAELALAVARAIAVCARSAAGVERASLSIRTSVEDEPGGQRVVVAVVDNGAGDAAGAAALIAALGDFARHLGGTFDGTSAAGQGCAFELRLPVASRASISR